MLHLSHRSEIMPASAIRKLVPYAEKAKERGKKVYHLNIGQPDIETPAPIMEAIRSYREKVLAYGPSKGLPCLREAIADSYRRLNIELSPDDISITEGASEAILFTYSVITDPGDEVIIFEPFYANYNGFAATMGVNLIPVTLRADNGFGLPPKEEIKAHVTHRTRAIQVCNPNNPTGNIFTEAEMNMIVEIAREEDLFIVSDEVYREFTYDGKKAKSFLEFPGMEDHVVVIDSISKQFSACGARIGALISRNRELLERALKYAQIRLCPSILGQVGATAAYRMDPAYFKPILEEYSRRRDLVVELLRRMDGVTCSVPAGTFYLMATLPVDDSDGFARFLLSDFDVEGETVMVAPGSGFYATKGLGRDEVRIAFVLERKSLERAMHILQKGLAAYRRES